MGKREKRARPVPRIGRRQAEAWVLTVINPLLETLGTASRYLSRRDWTWRFRGGGCELVLPTSAGVSIRYHPNLEHLLRHQPPIARAAGEYDDAALRLAQSCAKAHERLVRDPAFASAVADTESRYVELLPHQAPAGHYRREWWGAFPEDQRVALAAEHVVNNVVRLSEYLTDHLFWQHAGAGLLEFQQGDVHREGFEKLGLAGEDARCAAERLTERLESLRETLAEHFDVPPVPPELEPEGAQF